MGQGEKILNLLTFRNSDSLNNASGEAYSQIPAEETENRRTFGFKSKPKSLSRPMAAEPFRKTLAGNYMANNMNAGINSPKKEADNSPKKKPVFGKNNQNVQQNQIISGYFIKEKSYKEMVIARINNFLCGVLTLLVLVCLVSYYYVINGEITLNQIRKETLAINYENEDMQHKLDILQSFSNVDKQVTKTKILQTAKQVMELSAANLPNVKYENKNASPAPGWSMGY